MYYTVCFEVSLIFELLCISYRSQNSISSVGGSYKKYPEAFGSRGKGNMIIACSQ